MNKTPASYDRHQDIMNFLAWANNQIGTSNGTVREEGYSFGRWVSTYGNSSFETAEDDQVSDLIRAYIQENT